MSRLGYERYAVHGTDVGAGVVDLVAMVAPDRVVGTHLSGTVAAMPLGPELQTDGLTAPDRERAERFNEFRSEGVGYLHMQATRPATIGYSLNDSPVGQLAWIVDKLWAWTDPAKALPEDALDRDQLLTNASVYWFTGSGASSANGTYEGMQAWKQMAASQPPPAPAQAHRQTRPPTGVAVFAADTTIRSVMDPGGMIEHWSEFDRGGHFPAMESPDLLTNDLRDFFRKHR
jgi:pimeloyl-ACP methyl ester carboxylesterase